MVLCRRTAGGDQLAFRELVRRHEHRLRSFLRHLAGPQLGDELAQECFIKAWQSAGQFRSEANYLSWLCAIGWRCFVDHARRERRETRKAEALSSSSSSIELAAPGHDQQLDLARALALLTPEERASLILCEGEGWSHNEASEILRVPLGTLKGTIMRAKKKCREALEAVSQ
jgi:RNA polymerase sigma-70 factor (ECF subfamily)